MSKTLDEAAENFCIARRLDGRGYPPKEWFKAGYKYAQSIPLKERFEAVVEEYLAAFCKKQGFDRFDGYWIGDRVGEVFEIADMFFDFNDIRYDIDTNQPAEQIINWHWKMVDDTFDELSHTPFPNYENWCKMNTNTEEKK